MPLLVSRLFGREWHQGAQPESRHEVEAPVNIEEVQGHAPSVGLKLARHKCSITITPRKDDDRLKSISEIDFSLFWSLSRAVFRPSTPMVDECARETTEQRAAQVGIPSSLGQPRDVYLQFCDSLGSCRLQPPPLLEACLWLVRPGAAADNRTQT